MILSSASHLPIRFPSDSMATASCKETVAVRIMLVVQIFLAVFTFLMWSQPGSLRPGSLRPDAVLGEVVTVRCKNLFPERIVAIMNGVYVPPGAVRSVPISRTKLNITIELVVTGKPLNQALNTLYYVPISPKLVRFPRILFALKLHRYCKSCAGTNCKGFVTGYLKTPSALLGYFGFQQCLAQESPPEPPPAAEVAKFGRCQRDGSCRAKSES